MSAAMDAPVMRGQMARVEGGRRLRYVLAGPSVSQRPLILLEAGSFGLSADWAAVQELLAAEGLRSLAYDRAGLGHSDPGPMPRDSLAIVTDLEALLAAIGETGPVILCGHSMAGMHVRLYARRHAPRVKGLVLVDATTPEAMDHPAVTQFVSYFTTVSHLAAWGASVGLQKPLAGALGDGIGLPGAAKAEKQRAFADPGHNHWASVEVDAWAASAEHGRAAGALDPDWPVAVILTGDPRQVVARHDFQTVPAKAARQGFVVHVPGANHASLLGQRHAPHIVRAILSVETAAASA